MYNKFPEAILNQPIEKLAFGKQFKVTCEIPGFNFLTDLSERHTSELLKYLGFSYHLLTEYISFLELQKLARYIDAD